MFKLYVNPKNKKGHLNKELQGNFSEHLGRCIYEGLYVGDKSDIPNVNGMRTDVVEALKEMKLPVLRWPGGCFADEYHWMDGIGPKETRKKMINTHWGGVLEDNSFGTKEFFELCRQLGCETYINGNLGSGTVQEMSEWVEYMTFDGVSPMADLRKKNGNEDPWTVNFFGVGNENWGCGGNMTPEHYANEYRRYQTYVRHYPDSKHPDKPRIYKIACGANAADYNWTDTVMRIAGHHMDGISLHYYTLPTGDWGKKGAATGFSLDEYYSTLKNMSFTEELLRKHIAIMDKYDPEGRVGLIFDEWGAWYDVEPGTNPGFLYQQNTMRDAVLAGSTLNIFNKNCRRVRMANIAQLVNVLQSVILTEGAKMVKTPTYYIFKMYSDHQDNTLVESSITKEKVGTDKYKVDDLFESVSKAEDGTLTVTVANLSATDSKKIEAVITDYNISSVTGEIVTGAYGDFNTFDNKDVVTIKPFTGFTKTAAGLDIDMPACSVVKLTLKK